MRVGPRGTDRLHSFSGKREVLTIKGLCWVGTRRGHESAVGSCQMRVSYTALLERQPACRATGFLPSTRFYLVSQCPLLIITSHSKLSQPREPWLQALPGLSLGWAVACQALLQQSDPMPLLPGSSNSFLSLLPLLIPSFPPSFLFFFLIKFPHSAQFLNS